MCYLPPPQKKNQHHGRRGLCPTGVDIERDGSCPRVFLRFGKTSVSALMFASFSIITACGISTPESHDPLMGGVEVVRMDSWTQAEPCNGFSEIQCTSIAVANASLVAHTDSIYRWAGSFSSVAPYHHFKNDTLNIPELGVPPFFGFSIGTSIYLSDLAFIPNELQNTIAHEGARIGGRDETGAKAIGFQCAGVL